MYLQMGRNKANSKKAAKSGAGAGAASGSMASAKPALNKAKKAKNVFKVANNKGKKKPKEVQGKLKQVSPTKLARSFKIQTKVLFSRSKNPSRPSKRRLMPV